MGLEVWQMSEALPTHVTNVRFLSGVHSAEVEAEIRATAEALPAAVALIGLPPRVHSLMSPEIGDPTETLPALLTCIWLLSRVDPLPAVAAEAQAEALPIVTPVPPSVGPLVAAKVRAAAEASAAVSALIWLLYRVDSLVGLEV